MQMNTQVVNNSDQITPPGTMLKLPEVTGGLEGKVDKSDAQITPRSKMRASDLNLMTERGEEEVDRLAIGEEKTPQTHMFTHPPQINGDEITLDNVTRSAMHKRNKTEGGGGCIDTHKRQASNSEGESIRLGMAYQLGENTMMTQFQQNAAVHKVVRLNLGNNSRPFSSSFQSNLMIQRQNQSLEPAARLKNSSDREGDASVTEVNMVQSSRHFGPSSSQPPHPSFNPVISLREKRTLLNSIALKSPIRNTAAGNIGLLSTHMKLSRMSMMQKKSNRDFRDHQCDLLQERSIRLEDELIQTQTTLRQKEGSNRIKMALLEQQVTQMNQQMIDAKKREEQQKSTYEQILQIIHRQLLDANLSESSKNAILINLNYVQNILKDTSKGTFQMEKEGSIGKGSPNGTPCETPYLGKGENSSKTLDRSLLLQGELDEKSSLIDKLQKENNDLREKLAKFEAELEQQREREKKLQSMHKEEIKFKDEINGYEQQLFQSKIKELETNLASMHNKMRVFNMTEITKDSGSHVVANDNERGASKSRNQYQHSLRLDSIQNYLRTQKQRSSSNGCLRLPLNSAGPTPQKNVKVNGDVNLITTQSVQMCNRECQTEESVFQESIQKLIQGLRVEYSAGRRQKDGEIREMREKLEQIQLQTNQEKQSLSDQQEVVREQERADYDQRLGQKDIELNEANKQLLQKEKSNQTLREEIKYFKSQIEKIQKLHELMSTEKLRCSRQFKYMSGEGSVKINKSVKENPTATFAKDVELLPEVSIQCIKKACEVPQEKPDKIQKVQQALRDSVGHLNPGELLKRDKQARKKRKQKVLTIDLMNDGASPAKKKVGSPQTSKQFKNKILTVKVAVKPKGFNSGKKVTKPQGSPIEQQPLKKVLSTKRIVQNVLTSKNTRTRNVADGNHDQMYFKTLQSNQDQTKKLISPKCPQDDCINRSRKSGEDELSCERSQKEQRAGICHTIERRKVLKPTLKSRSSSKVASVKQELVKKLLELRSSGGHRLSSIEDDVKKPENVQDKMMNLNLVSKYSQMSNQSLNLQVINHNTAIKKIQSELKSDQSQSKLNNTTTAQIREDRNALQNTSQASFAHNRQQLEKYSLHHNHRLLSLNGHKRNKPLGAYGGKIKNSRYDTISESSRCQTTEENEQQIYFGDVTQKKKFIANLSQKSPVVTPGKEENTSTGRPNVQSSSKGYRRQQDYCRPEIQIALSEGSQLGDIGQFGGGCIVNEIQSTQLSTVQQEASKSCVKEVIPGVPGLEQRRLHDDYEFAARDSQLKSNHTRNNTNRTSCVTEVLQEPVQAINRSNLKIQVKNAGPKQTQRVIEYPERQMSSECFDTSIGSELENDEQEETPITVSVKQGFVNDIREEIKNQAPTRQCKHCTSNQNAMLFSPHFLEKLDDLYGRIQLRDIKISKLKTRCKTLKQKVLDFEKSQNELNDRIQEKENENQGLQILVQKFECRLKQAQIVLNDNDDRVDLQLSRSAIDLNSHEEEINQLQHFISYEDHQNDMMNSMPHSLDMLRVQSSIINLQRKKSQIKIAERSRQRSLRKVQINELDGLSARDKQCKTALNSHRFNSKGVVVSKSPTNALQQYQQWAEAQLNGGDSSSIFGKRSNSLSSPLNLHQFKRNFQSMNKLNRKSAAMMKGHRVAVPVIDLSYLNQSKQSDAGELSNQGQVDMIDLVQPMAQRIVNTPHAGQPSCNPRGNLTGRQNPRVVLGGDTIGSMPLYQDAYIRRQVETQNNSMQQNLDGSMTCHILATGNCKDNNEPNSSASTTQNQQTGEQGRATVGVFKFLDLQENKSTFSTQPSKTMMGGADCSKRSAGDSKSSLFNYPRTKKVQSRKTTKIGSQFSQAVQINASKMMPPKSIKNAGGPHSTMDNASPKSFSRINLKF